MSVKNKGRKRIHPDGDCLDTYSFRTEPRIAETIKAAYPSLSEGVRLLIEWVYEQTGGNLPLPKDAVIIVHKASATKTNRATPTVD